MKPQRARTPQLLVVASSMALAAFALGSSAIGFIMAELGAMVFAVGACAGLLSFCVGLLVLRLAWARPQAVITCLGVTVLAAALNAPLSFLVVSAFDPSGSGRDFMGLFGGVIASFIVGAFITVPLGSVAFGIPFMVLVGFTHGASRDRACEALDSTARASGLWLAAMGLVCFVARSVELHAAQALPDQVAALLRDLGAALVLLGCLAAAVAEVRLRSRRRFVSRVRKGLEPGWELRAADAVERQTVRPLFLGGKEPHETVLARRSAGKEAGAYRTGDQLEPVALL